MLAPGRDVPHRLADLRQRTQIVVLRHPLLIAPFLALVSETINTWANSPWGAWPRWMTSPPVVVYFAGEQSGLIIRAVLVGRQWRNARRVDHSESNL